MLQNLTQLKHINSIKTQILDNIKLLKVFSKQQLEKVVEKIRDESKDQVEVEKLLKWLFQKLKIRIYKNPKINLYSIRNLEIAKITQYQKQIRQSQVTIKKQQNLHIEQKIEEPPTTQLMKFNIVQRINNQSYQMIKKAGFMKKSKKYFYKADYSSRTKLQNLICSLLNNHGNGKIVIVGGLSSISQEIILGSVKQILQKAIYPWIDRKDCASIIRYTVCYQRIDEELDWKKVMVLTVDRQVFEKYKRKLFCVITGLFGKHNSYIINFFKRDNKFSFFVRNVILMDARMIGQRLFIPGIDRKLFDFQLQNK